jgi:RNA polymerase sigma-70 factor (ECF subfamily)
VGTGQARQDELVAQAVWGDEAALQRLLVASHDSLVAHIANRMPKDLQSSVSSDDVFQNACVVVFRKIREFEPGVSGGFDAWLMTIADRCLTDLIDAQRCLKRGGRHGPVHAVKQDFSTIIDLLELVAVHSRTPSRSVAEHEAVAATRTALENLPDAQRTALQMRYLEGLSVAETAGRMERTVGSVRMLCSRGLASLRGQLGDLSRFLTHLP